MDKALIIDDGSNGAPAIYKLKPYLSPIHKTFGLWICIIGRGGESIYSSKNGKAYIKPRMYTFYSISHMFEGAGFYWNKEKGEKKLKKGDCIISTPNFVQSYGPYPNDENLSYIEDNICFTGPLADNLFKSDIIKNQSFYLGKTRTLLPIIDKAMDPSRDAQIEANKELINFLISVYLENKKSSASSLNTKFDMLMKEIINNPSKWWSVEEMAENCNLSVSHFRATFHKYSGMSPKLYIDKVKLGIASEKLRNTNQKIEKIAQALGYVDPYHFSRRFKQVMGVSPSQCRKMKI